ncbi:hypothetical protein [Facklamia lactis]|uniref:hypothetical protein n=1 Tax=Facklamia lactis TaxID=2749967 RepID=UPI0018CE9008|nr:hypothetical protein [Facklamia lactis]MBG9981086.1 hypothetical protein [Facklamia lactis]
MEGVKKLMKNPYLSGALFVILGYCGGVFIRYGFTGKFQFDWFIFICVMIGYLIGIKIREKLMNSR